MMINILKIDTICMCLAPSNRSVMRL